MRKNLNYQKDLAVLMRLLNESASYDYGVEVSAPLCPHCLTRGIDVVKLRRLVSEYPVPVTKAGKEAYRNLARFCTVRRRREGFAVIRPDDEFRKAYHSRAEKLN